jgi:hypothetical protein
MLVGGLWGKGDFLRETTPQAWIIENILREVL